MALGRGHGGGGHGGHHGGGGRRFGGRGFGPSWGGGGPWYDYDYGPLVLVEDDDDDQRRIAMLAAQAAAAAVAAQAKAPTKGLGIFRPHDRVAHPLDHGRGRRRAVQGLGAATGPVPSACWDAAGFKDCQGRVFAKAQSICNASGPYPNAAWATAEDCTKDYTDTFVGPSAESSTCVSTFCPNAAGASASSSGGSYPWNTYSAATLTLQKATNVALKAAGYCPIGEDGKLGAGTCGARKELQSSGAVPGMSWPTTCQKFTTPSKQPCGGGGGGYTPPSLPSTLPSGPMPTTQASMFGGGSWKTAALIGGGLAVAGLVYYFVRKKQAEEA